MNDGCTFFQGFLATSPPNQENRRGCVPEVGIFYVPEGLCRREDKTLYHLNIFHADCVARPGFKDISPGRSVFHHGEGGLLFHHRGIRSDRSPGSRTINPEEQDIRTGDWGEGGTPFNIS